MRSSNSLPDEWVKRVWQRLSDAYGRQFSSQFANENELQSWRETWAEGLAGLSSEHVGFGVQQMARRESPFPPSLGEFSTLCRGYHPPLTPPQAMEASARLITPDLREELTSAAKRLASAERGPWWTPKRVETAAQVRYIVAQANHFGEGSEAANFLARCKSAGVLTHGNELAVSRGATEQAA